MIGLEEEMPGVYVLGIAVIIASIVNTRLVGCGTIIYVRGIRQFLIFGGVAGLGLDLFPGGKEYDDRYKARVARHELRIRTVR